MLEDEREDYLLNLLTRVRDIGALEDDQAMEELAAVVLELRAGRNWALDQARRELADVREEARHLAAVVERGIPLESWRAGHRFLERVDDLGRQWPHEIREQLAGDIAEGRHLAEPIARDAAAHGINVLIDAYLVKPFANVQEGVRMFRELAEGEEVLSRLGALESSAGRLRAARERLVRYRWSRRMEEAEVAEAGGNAKKAGKLRAEARVILKHDWLRAFPNEEPPA